MVEAQVKEGMLCPVCRTDLMMTDRQGVEIDYCPRCRGVWLDRGELDKIVERSAGGSSGPSPRSGGHGYERRGDRDYDNEDSDRRQGRRGSWLEDIFDFG